MAETVTWRSVVWQALLLAALAGCAAGAPPSMQQQRHTQISRELDAFGQGLRAGSWSRVERFFSPAYRDGYSELRDRIEEGPRNQRIVDLQFIVNRVLESEGLVNAQVRWNKSWVDKTGKPGKASGTSEFLLQPQDRGYRILRISGDRLF